MKWKTITATVMSVIFFFTGSVSAGESMLQFMEDTMKSLSTLRPQTYKGQERGYFVGGSASIKFPNENIQPFSFTPPQLKAGCGGIDIIMGGFSYLNFDYLVQKLQQILQVAPAFAFELALGTLCKDCKNILSSLDNLANQINQMNLNQCQTAKALAGYVGKKFGWLTSHEQSTGKCNSWFSCAAKNLGNMTQEFNNWIKENAAAYDGKDVKATFSFRPSLLHNAFQKAGSYTYLEPFIRALVGDYNEVKAHDEGTYVPNRIPACPQASADAQAALDSLLNGSYWVRNIDETAGTPYACTQTASSEHFSDRVRNKIACIGYKMKISLGRSATAPTSCTGTALTTEELSLINNLEIPIIPFLRAAIALDEPEVYETTIDQLTEVAALQVAYLSFARLVGIAQESLNNYEGQSMKFNTAAKSYFRDLKDEMLSLKREAYKRYSSKLREVRTVYGSFLQKHLEIKLKLYKALKEQNLLQNYLFQVRMERG